MTPPNQDLYRAARERLRQKPRPKKLGLSTFARPPQPKAPMTGYKRQQSY